MKKTVGAVALVFLGLFLFVIASELFLQAAGLIFAPSGKIKEFEFSRKAGEHTILCLGDSFTQGIGAGPDQDYPAQLKKLLNSNTAKKFRVINIGMGG